MLRLFVLTSVLDRFFAVVAVAAFALSPACADPSQSAGAAPKGDLETARPRDSGAPGTDNKNRLQAGVFTADVHAVAPQSPISPGGSAFAQITISQDGAVKGDESELVLEAESGAIRSVTGVKAKDDGQPGAYRVRAADMKKGRRIQVLVEVRLDDMPMPPGTTRAPNRLRVMLREPDSDKGEATLLRWTVADCIDSYPSTFPRLLQGPAAQMQMTLKAARFGDRTRPGRWLFRPARALLAKRKRDADEEDPAQSREREIIRAANVLVHTRTVQRDLLPRQKIGLVSRKVATDLRRYLAQDASPALCTGVPEMLGWFDNKLDDLRKRTEEADKFALAAAALASEKTQAALDLRPLASDAAAGPVETTASLPQIGGSDADLKRYVGALAALGASEETQQAVGDAPSAFDALRSLRKGAKPLLGKQPPEELRNAVGSALTMIEAADYLARGGARFTSVRAGIEESMTAIRDAQRAGCACSQRAQNAR